MQFVGGGDEHQFTMPLTAEAHRDINAAMITSKAITALLIGTLLA